MPRFLRCPRCDGFVPEAYNTCPHCQLPLGGGTRLLSRLSQRLPPFARTVTGLLLTSYGVLLVLPILLYGGRPDFSLTHYLFKGDMCALVQMGANYGPLLEYGQLWRLLTATFLHGGLIHLFFNGYALKMLGPGLELLYGGSWFFFITMLCGVGGSLLSWQVHGILWANIGASGAIFGLIGLGIAHCWRHRWANRALLNLLIQWAVMGFAFGLMGGIDNWAHLGGFLTGLGLGFLLPAERLQTGRLSRLSLPVGLLTLAAVLICFLLQILSPAVACG